MAITLDLPDELEAALSDEADRLNLPLGEYIVRLLMTAQPQQTMPRTGAELVAYWQREGLIGTRPLHDQALRNAVSQESSLMAMADDPDIQ